MKLKYLTAIAFTAMALNSCDEETGTIGNSLTATADALAVATSEFNVLTNSFIPDSVYSYSEQCYLGKIEDPETGTTVKSDFMVQFNMMEDKHLPSESAILSKEDGKVIADSCDIILFLNKSASYGDSLAALKVKVSELDKPVGDGMHYTSFNPKESGYVRVGGLQKTRMVTMADLTLSDSVRANYVPYIRIRLNDPYTDKNGVTYNNYGTYVLRNYYEHPEYFKNSYAFIHNICPGFFIETIDGEGMMANFSSIQLRAYYKYQSDETAYISYLDASSTQEVLQTITVTNNKEALRQLSDDASCTYLKTPAGIFTEVSLPVDDIKSTHATDSLLSASVVFNRLNNQKALTDYTFDAPQQVMLIQKDSLQSFFENTRNYNNLYAFYTTLSKNAYSFSSSSDISNLVVRMYNAKQNGLKSDPQWVENHPNWNKALLVPVSPITIATSTTTSTATPISLGHEMGLTSTRLVRGTADNPIKINVIYAKFND